MLIDPKLLALFTAISFGMAPVVLKLAFRAGGTTGIGMIIGLLVAVPANLVVALFVNPHLELLTPFAVLAFALAGLAGSAVGRRWIYQSINLLGPSRASTLRSTSPVFTAVAAAALYQEDVSLLRWLGIAAIVVGGALVSWQPGTGARGWLNIGVLYALGSAVSYAFRPLFLKLGLEQADAPLAAACIGSIAALGYALALEDLSKLKITKIDRSFRFFFLGGILQTVSQLGLTYGIAGADVSLIYSITASSPLFTLIFTAILLRGVERITPLIALGVVLTVSGVILL